MAPDHGFDAVLVHYGRGGERAVELAGQLLAASPAPGRVILWDNSPDASGLGGLPLPPRVELLSSANVGWGRAVNAALERVVAPVALLLNPDVTPESSAVAACVAAVAGDPAVAVPTVRQRCGNAVPLYGVVAIGAAEVIGWRWSDRLFRPEGIAVTMEAAAVSVVWHRRIGGFDPRFFMYNEDYDWCRRAVSAGARCVALETAPCGHEGGASWDGAGPRLFWVFDSEARYLVKWFGRAAIPVFIVRLAKGAVLVPALRIAAVLLRRERLRYLAVREGLRLGATARWLWAAVRQGSG